MKGKSKIQSVEIGARHRLDHLFPSVADCCTLTVACPPADYSASRIARAVEDVDAHLLNLNVTAPRLHEPAAEGMVMVELRVGLRNGQSVARSLERYGLSVVSIESTVDTPDDTTRRRVNELIHYLEV